MGVPWRSTSARAFVGQEFVDAGIPGALYVFSGPEKPEPPAEFRRGDCDGDGQVNPDLTDAVFPPQLQLPRRARAALPRSLRCGTATGESPARSHDAVYLLTHNFLGGRPRGRAVSGLRRGRARDRHDPWVHDSACELPLA